MPLAMLMLLPLSCRSSMTLLAHILVKFVVVYLDNSLVFNKTWIEHSHHVWTFLDLFSQHRLQEKMKKPFFGQTFVQYLGFVIDKTGAHIDYSKAKEWPCPISTTDLKSSLWGTYFHRKLICHYSHIVHPLNQPSNQKLFIVLLK